MPNSDQTKIKLRYFRAMMVATSTSSDFLPNRKKGKVVAWPTHRFFWGFVLLPIGFFLAEGCVTYETAGFGVDMKQPERAVRRGG